MMKLDRHEADGGPVYLDDPHPLTLRGADVLHSPSLIFLPVRVQSPEDLGPQHPLERREDRPPRPKREADNRLGVSIVKWPNPWPHGLRTSRHQRKPNPTALYARAKILRAEGSTRRSSRLGENSHGALA